MKQLLIAVATILISFAGFSQTKTYVTTGGEMIFSFANIEKNGLREGPDLRWAPVFNIQSMLNRDLTSHLGVFTGLAVRNVGYIYGNYTDPSDENIYKKKFRSYNLAVPFGIKLGDLNRMFIYGGYELEIPFLYKEKTFNGGDKIDKITGWFSPRQEQFQHGFMVGIQFPYRMNLKFKYYLSEFHNREYIDGSGNRPYAGLKTHIFYFSLNSYLFRNLDFYTADHPKNLIL